MDSSNCQTLTASAAEPGGLPVWTSTPCINTPTTKPVAAKDTIPDYTTAFAFTPMVSTGSLWFAASARQCDGR